LLQESGYFNVSIEPDYSYDEIYHLVAVILKVKSTPERAKIGTIHFNDGQQVLSEKELSGAMKVYKGDKYNADKVDKGVDKIRKKFVEQGYLTAKVRAE